MARTRQAFARELIAVAEEAGIADVRIEHGSKHPKLRGCIGSKAFTYTFPASPSCHRSLMNAKSGVRRLARQQINP